VDADLTMQDMHGRPVSHASVMPLANISSMLGHQRVDYLKQDIESYEFDVLAGVLLLLARAWMGQIHRAVPLDQPQRSAVHPGRLVCLALLGVRPRGPFDLPSPT
jgi:hypothetical protein